MPSPNNCIKGIPNHSYINKDGTVGSHLFHFDLKNIRSDGWTEQSINWEDDGSVRDFTMNQKKDDGEIHFKAGLSVIPLEEIDRLSSRPTIRGLLSYERQPLKDNPFHGNILLKGQTSKPTMKQIAAGLALAVSEIILRNE